MFNNNYYKLLLVMTKIADSSVNTANANVTYYDGTTGDTKAFRASSSYAYTPLSLAMILTASDNYVPALCQLSNSVTVYALTSNFTDTNNSYGCIIGDGNTPPALTDYCLSGNQITNFTATTTVSASYNNAGAIEIVATYNITNTGAEAFTIREFAICRATSTPKRIMIARDVLESPITIEASNTGILTYKLDIAA